MRILAIDHGTKRMGVALSDELGMIAEGGSHRANDALGIVPIHIAVHAIGATGAFVQRETALVDGQNLRILFRQPDGR